MKPKRLLVITSSAFPRWKNDTESTHMFSINSNLVKKGYTVVMLAPHHPGAKKVEVMGNLKIYRFSYFWPNSLQKLCYDGGILLNMKRSLLAKIQLPFFFLAEIFAVLSIAKKEKIEFIQANWLLPQGIAARIAKKLLGIRYGVSAHAADVFPMKAKSLKMLLRTVLKHCDLCIANSTYTQSFLHKIKKPKGSRVIPIGIDLSYYKKKQERRSASKKEVFASRSIFVLSWQIC